MSTVKIKQIRSAIGRTPEVKATLKALGLGRIGKTKTIKSNPATVGMIDKVAHLLKVEQS